ncbi:MAG: hypothetical protein ABSB88_10255 [Bryobacteraceae bacterium]|jgi:hypothetical protein
MDKVVARLSTIEILGVLAPGFVALIALHAWLRFDLTDVLGPSVSGNSLAVTVTVLIAAYAVGSLLLEWVNAGTRYFMRVQLEQLGRPERLGTSARRRVLDAGVWLMHGMPLPRMRFSFVRAQVMMSEFNESVSHTFESSRFSSPWQRLDMFRKLVSRVSVPNASTVLTAVADAHARLLFMLSLSLTLALIAVVGALLSAVTIVRCHQLSPLLLLVCASGLGSYPLRLVAARYWEQEIILVCSLGEWRTFG